MKKKIYFQKKKKFFSIKFHLIKSIIFKQLTIFFLLAIILFTFKNKNMTSTEEQEEEIIPKKEDIYKIEIFDSKNEAFEKAKDFLNKCKNGILLHEKPFVASEKPKLSVVIPLYNCKHFISSSIRSIQNQNISDLEIILVNDNSTDNTLSFVEKMQKEDPRIKIINNQKNMGILYSRSIGALSAKGKYIFPLDNDDMILDKDVFDTILNISQKGNFDIVEFKGIQVISPINIRRIHDTYFSNHKLNLVMFQPELGNYPFILSNKTGNYGYRDVYLWVKCIKTKIYQKALNKLGVERYSRFMLIHEDIVASCILFNTAKSYKFIGKYGVYHVRRGGSASFKRFGKKEMNIFNLYVLDAAIDFTQETKENKLLLVYLIIYLINQPDIKESLNNDYNKNLFISCFNRILESKYISIENKNLIKDKVKKLDFLNYQFLK